MAAGDVRVLDDATVRFRSVRYRFGGDGDGAQLQRTLQRDREAIVHRDDQQTAAQRGKILRRL